MKQKSPCTSAKALSQLKMSCRGRVRTSTEQLAAAQIRRESYSQNNWWSTPVGPPVGGSALCSVYPVISTPETRGHVCQAYAISSPHNLIKEVPVAIGIDGTNIEASG